MLAGKCGASAGLPGANCFPHVLCSCLVSLLIVIALAVAGDGVKAERKLLGSTCKHVRGLHRMEMRGEFWASVFTNIVLVH